MTPSYLVHFGFLFGGTGLLYAMLKTEASQLGTAANHGRAFYEKIVC
jgi:hypothetical protein